MHGFTGAGAGVGESNRGSGGNAVAAAERTQGGAAAGRQAGVIGFGDGWRGNGQPQLGDGADRVGRVGDVVARCDVGAAVLDDHRRGGDGLVGRADVLGVEAQCWRGGNAVAAGQCAVGRGAAGAGGAVVGLADKGCSDGQGLLADGEVVVAPGKTVRRGTAGNIGKRQQVGRAVSVAARRGGVGKVGAPIQRDATGAAAETVLAG